MNVLVREHLVRFDNQNREGKNQANSSKLGELPSSYFRRCHPRTLRPSVQRRHSRYERQPVGIHFRVVYPAYGGPAEILVTRRDIWGNKERDVPMKIHRQSSQVRFERVYKVFFALDLHQIFSLPSFSSHPLFPSSIIPFYSPTQPTRLQPAP